jgi:outer membrane protein OmpA-like peptidoglycan-associated protein
MRSFIPVREARPRPDDLGLPSALLAALLSGCAAPPPPPAAPLSVRVPPERALELPLSTEIGALELHPRVEIGEAIPADATSPRRRAAAVLLALPSDRSAMRRVDVSVTVKRRPDGEVTDARRITWSRDTKEGSLRLALAPLPAGAYDVEVHTVAQLDVVDDEDATVVTDTREATEQAPIVLAPEGEPRTASFDFHFMNDAAVLIPADGRELDRTVASIGALYAAHPDATARVDCWASADGPEARNRALAERRCAWFEAGVWERLAKPKGAPLERIAHGSRDAPVAGADKKLQEQNRVVHLRIQWFE